MPRPPRFSPPGVPQHVVQRAHRREACFFEDGDREFYLALLNEHARRHGCHVHAYVLMSNHVHLLMTPQHGEVIGRMMQGIGRIYVRRINDRLGRRGTLWEGRYRACLVDSERYLLACHRYIELNPVRAGLVSGPKDYRWSSFGGNALGLPDPILTPHPVIASLGKTPEARRLAYLALFRERLSEQDIDRLRYHIRTQRPLSQEPTPAFQPGSDPRL
jgi:putative transposase